MHIRQCQAAMLSLPTPLPPPARASFLILMLHQSPSPPLLVHPRPSPCFSTAPTHPASHAPTHGHGADVTARKRPRLKSARPRQDADQILGFWTGGLKRDLSSGVAFVAYRRGAGPSKPSRLRAVGRRGAALAPRPLAA
eukprot:2505483-Rhodomonas_salina.1